MTFKLTYENMLYLALGLISIIIIYKLFTIYNTNSNIQEGFQGIINKFKNTRHNRKSIYNKTKKSNKLSFDDLITEAEDMDPNKYTIDSIKNNFFTYLESFQKAKFNNVSGSTNEALEKFSFFKDKFFEIFK